jgi:vesicle transport through interaction with t-SNAREs protein 1
MMSTSSSLSLLTQFEQQYSVQTAEITARIGALKALASGDRPVAIQTVQRMLADVHDLLEQMEMSVRDLDPSRSVCVCVYVCVFTK